MPNTVFLGAARTPIGKMGGGLSTLPAPELGGLAISAALERAEVEPEQVDHVIFGQVLQAGQGQIPSRQAQIEGGIPKEVSSETINKVCASGVRAVGLLDPAIRGGDLQVGVGGGMESMSNAPYCSQARFGFRMGDAKALDAMVHDGLTNPFSGKQMFVEATEVGDELEMTRADLDRWALRSHELALKASDEGRLSRGDRRRHDQRAEGRHDRRGRRGPAPRDLAGGAGEAPRPGWQGGLAHRRQLPRRQRRRRCAGARLRRVGAANGKRPLGEIVAHAQSANDFAYLATTPATAARKALEKAGLQPGDIDLWEINEAFASVTLNSIRMLGIDEDRVNVNGGPSRSGTRSAPPAPAFSAASCSSCAVAAAASAARRSAPVAARATR